MNHKPQPPGRYTRAERWDMTRHVEIPATVQPHYEQASSIWQVGYRFSIEAPAPGPGPELTTRQREVLSWAAKGLSTKATAQKLRIGADTVKHHRALATAAMGVKTFNAAVHEATRRGLI